MERENKELDKTLRETFKEIGVEKPTSLFLDNVMSKIEEIKTEKVYQPLISSKLWWVIAATITALVVMSFYTTSSIQFNELISFDKLKLSDIEIPSFDLFSSLAIPKSVSYGIIMASFLILTQIYFLKNRLYRNIEDR
ncbi:hypothetical protein GTQ40_02370 [Flavobacteriaceae bacterium R38]|nr:hypothetical protein [Flavobacteriaceae bacterium R38]